MDEDEIRSRINFLERQLQEVGEAKLTADPHQTAPRIYTRSDDKWKLSLELSSLRRTICNELDNLRQRLGSSEI